MSEPYPHIDDDDETFWAPGTVRLEDLTRTTTEVILHPIPTSDPDDPLNWSTARKMLNFSLVGFYVLWTFAQLQVGSPSWGQLIAQLHLTVDQLNNGVAMTNAGLSIGCMLFMPFVHKYGRRPLYMISVALQLAGVAWQSQINSYGGYMGANFIAGLGGALSEAVVQVTIADIFFLHEHGTMNAWYLVFTAVGATLGPVASGFVVQSQGWRWIWHWCTIFIAINMFLVTFCFEESKYIPILEGEQGSSAVNTTAVDLEQKSETKTAEDIKHTAFQRMALVTPSDYSIAHHFYQPIYVLFLFPAVAYAALTYGTILACLALMSSMQATYLIRPPYNFSPSGVGLMNLAPFTGTFLGFFAGGWLNDRAMLFFARRNGGIYEPEMRLRLGLAAAFILPGGVLIFGLVLSRGLHWMGMAVGFGLFGFTFVLASGIALAYVTDCEGLQILGDAMIGIVFMRNVFSVIILFTLSPWTKAMGIQNVALITAAFCFLVLLMPIPLIIWGKRMRVYTAKKYQQMAMRQPAHRSLGEHL